MLEKKDVWAGAPKFSVMSQVESLVTDAGGVLNYAVLGGTNT